MHSWEKNRCCTQMAYIRARVYTEMVVPKLADILTLASLIENCTITKNLISLHKLHCQAIKLGFSYNDFIRRKLISSYTSCAQMADAHLIFSFTNRKSTFLYNTLIRGYASTKDFHLSLYTFNQMRIANTIVDFNTMPAVLKSVASLSLLKFGQQLHTSVLVRGLFFDLAHMNSFVTMYGKCGDLRCARKVFDEMPERNLISWTCMMNVYGIHGEFDEIFCLFDRMVHLVGVLPDEAAFTTVLTACSHGGKVEKGKEYFDVLINWFGLKPRMEHYTCMVDMFGRAGKIDDAKRVIESMDMEPDQALWRAFLASCRIHGKFEIVVRGKLFRLAD